MITAPAQESLNYLKRNNHRQRVNIKIYHGQSIKDYIQDITNEYLATAISLALQLLAKT